MKVRKPAEMRFIKALIFAPAGAGKTVLLGTAQQDERTFPMCFLDFEGGDESLAGLDIDVFEIRSWQDYNEVYEALANGDTWEIDGVEYDFTKYKSIGIDSISETHRFALMEILRKEGPSRRDPDLIEQGDYGRASVQLRRLLREFRDLPFHVFYVAHAKQDELPREGMVRLPDLAGKLAEEISGIVSVQGYLAQFVENDETHRTLLLNGFPKFRVKSRTPWGVAGPEEIIDPTVSTLLDALGYGGATRYEQEGSSRGKHIDDEAPVDQPGRLPGREDTSGDLPGEDGDSDESPGLDLDKLTMREMKAHAEAIGLDLNGIRTRAQARAAIEAHQDDLASSAPHGTAN